MERYTQIKVLGKGSFGSAWLIRRNEDKAQFVAKEVRLGGLKPSEREGAKHEIDMLRALNHPNITRYVDHFEHRGSLFIVMEYANGGDLYMKIKERRGALFSEKEVLHFFSQICLALAYLHDRRILHRDLKTQNVFLTRDGIVKLGDFGISTVLRNTCELKRTVCGTPYYFSPELCMNRPYNNKSDVWALGCILYELATLNHAFDGANMKALVQRILKGVYPPLHSSYSKELSRLISSMLQIDPSLRPNASQIIDMPFIRASLASLQKEVHVAQEGKTSVVPIDEQVRQRYEAMQRLDDYNMREKERAAHVAEQRQAQRAAAERKQREEEARRRDAADKRALLMQERKRELDARVREQRRMVGGRENEQQLQRRREKWENNMREQVEEDKRRREAEAEHGRAQAVCPPPPQQQQVSAAEMYKEMRRQAAANKQRMYAELGYSPPSQQQQQAAPPARMVFPASPPPPPREPSPPGPEHIPTSKLTEEQKDARTQAFWQMRKEAELNRRKARDESERVDSVAEEEPPQMPPETGSPCPTPAEGSPVRSPRNDVSDGDATGDADGEEGYRAFLNGEAAAAAEEGTKQRDEDYGALQTAISKALDSVTCGETVDFQDEWDGGACDLTKFVLDGNTLLLPNVADTDPLMHRIESLRLFLEGKMGEDTLLTCYKAMNNISTTDDNAIQRISEALPKSDRRYLPLVMQLIVCEDVFNRQGPRRVRT